MNRIIFSNAPDCLLTFVTSAIHHAATDKEDWFDENIGGLDLKTAPGAPFHSRHDTAGRLIGREFALGNDPKEILKDARDWARRCDPPFEELKVVRFCYDILAKEFAKVAVPAREKPPWPVFDEAALYGLAGDIVRAIEPETEADRDAILIQFFTFYGNAIGRSPYYRVEATKHRTNLFSVLVGETGQGRKGTSEDRVKELFTGTCVQWLPRIAKGLATPEGLAWSVRDQIERKEPIKEKGRIVNYQMVIVDHGIEDKRLLICESEFSAPLRVMDRVGNPLSEMVRVAWDGGILENMSKNSPCTATGAHISIVGHITPNDLHKYLGEVQGFNGFANRFLWICVRKSKELSDGGKPIDLNPFTNRLEHVIQFANTVGEMHRDEDAKALWAELYHEMSKGQPGLLGAVTNRAAPQTLRLSMIYALLDGSAIIRIEHLRAAYALWRYAEDSARYIFGGAIGDAKTEKVLEIIRSSGPLTRTQIHKKLSNHMNAEELDCKLWKLRTQGLIRSEWDTKTGGRPAERWSAT